MHGSGLNKSNAPRISLDLRFMKKDLKINKKSNSTNKDIFQFYNKMREFQIINLLSRFRINS